MILTLDPSINYCGYCVCDNDIEDNKNGRFDIVEAGLLQPKRKRMTPWKDEYEKAFDIYMQIRGIYYRYQYDITAIVMEVPAHWAVGGFIARESGSIYKLTFLCGMVATFHARQCFVYMAYPDEWKGQMDKDVCLNRLREYLPQYSDYLKDINHNVADAIEIGYWYLLRNPKGLKI